MIVGLLSLLILPVFVEPVSADRGGRHDDRRDSRNYRDRGYVLDRRHHHDRYYPPRDRFVTSVPRGHRVVPHSGTDYYFHAGVWYRPSGSRYRVVMPPIGVYVPVLPPFYTTVWVGGFPYYYAAGVYYSWRPDYNAYVVTEPPPESEVVEQAAVPDQLFIYPMNRQSEQQQSTDRYECHRWASDQSGFDPTQPGGNVPQEHYSERSGDYNRAMKACLEARGYSVQ